MIPIDEFNRDPLYAQLHDRLQAMIQDGTFQLGQRLPSEVDLSGMMGVSRPTVREALRLLEHSGMIARRHGVGTFVIRSAPLQSGLERLESLLSLAALQGREAKVLDLKVAEVPADEAIGNRLRVATGTLITAVRRTISIDGIPVSWMEDFVPASCMRAADLDSSFNGSVLDLLRLRNKTRVVKARAEISAVDADPLLAKRLAVGRGTALVLIRETLEDLSGSPIDFSFNYSVPGRLELWLVRT